MSLETLILLYALADSVDIPKSCFVALWIIFAARVICAIVRAVADAHEDVYGKKYNK